MTNLKPLLLGLVLGAAVTTVTFKLTGPDGQERDETAAQKGKVPLYWVAPMDPDYRRDKPGKSPMGMDLVPVYDDATTEPSAGTITISPAVEHNLGVRTAEVSRKALNVPIKTVGYVQYNEDTLVHIHPRVEGWVETLFVKAAGEYVKKGQDLYALYSPQLVNAQEELLLALKRNNKELIEAAKSRLIALHMPSQAIKQLMSNRRVQQTVVFKAPQTGFVDNLHIREGFYIQPGTTMMSIGALDQVWVDAEVFERQTAQIKPGMSVTMELDFLPGRQWLGQVDYVYPTLDQATRTLRVRLRFDNENYLLKPNMFAQITIHSEVQHQSLVVPSEAVIRTGLQNRVVLSQGEGRFKSVAVQLGRVTDDYIEISHGLQEGDRIVTSAQFLLDSESSISSDFKRMASRENNDHMMHMEHMEHSETMQHTAHTPSESPNQATVNGVINALNRDNRTVNISREAIEKWQRPAATMDFVVASGIALTEFEVGKEITFTFEVEQGDFTIIAVEQHHAKPNSNDDQHEGHH